MPTDAVSRSELLEERRFLSTASATGAVAAPHVATAAQHATPIANAARVASAAAKSEAADAEDSAQAAPAPAPTTPPAATENEDQTDTVAQSNDSVARSNSTSPEPTIEAALPQSPIRSAAISNATAFESRALLENIAIASDAELGRPSNDAPRADVTAVVFNTRYLVTPHDGEARVAAFPLATLSAPQALGAFSARAPVILKSTTDALLGLGRPDVLGTFADAITSFAHESAAAAAAAAGTLLASSETHYYKWEVTGAVLGIDALLIGHWYAIRRRRIAAAAGAMPTFSTRAIREVEGGRDARIC